MIIEDPIIFKVIYDDKNEKVSISKNNLINYLKNVPSKYRYDNYYKFDIKLFLTCNEGYEKMFFIVINGNTLKILRSRFSSII